jgi:fructose-1,6-bisphosphatase/inositol monophosphatase family enzyme
MHALDRSVSHLMTAVATEIVLPRFKNLRADEIEEKSPDDYVTIADKESELRLYDGLLRILPDAGVIGEEATAADPSLIDRAGDGLVWIVDPIDGTSNFAAGRAPFGIMVALVDNGTAQAGWILDPLSGRMCHAVLGGGAFVDGVPITARATGADLPITALATYFLSPDAHADLVERATGKLTLVDIPRCAAEQYPRLVLGENDIGSFERALPWDHAPGALFVNEAGGKLCRRNGSPYIIGDRQNGLLGASSPALWDLAARILFG